MRRADRRSLLLLILASAPIIIVAWFSLQQWNENGRELAAAESATGPVSAMYAAYSVVNVISHAQLFMQAAAHPQASADTAATAEVAAQQFETDLEIEITKFEALLPTLADSLDQNTEQTVELLDLAGDATAQAIRGHQVGDPPPAVFSFVVAPARDQLINVVAPTVASSVSSLQNDEELLLQLLRLDAAYDSDLLHLLRDGPAPTELAIDAARRVRWDADQQAWTLAFGQLSGETDISQIDIGAVSATDNPITPALVALSKLDSSATPSERSELVLAALQGDKRLTTAIDEAHDSLLAGSASLRSELERGRTLAALAGLLMTALGFALFGLIVWEIRDRRSVGRAHDAALGEMAELANRDSLTGLRNRRWLDIELARALSERDRDEELGVVYVDVDRFKGINDVWGHQMGDVVLRVVAQRMQEAAKNLHEFELVRFGGDEFVGLAKMPAGSTDADLEEIGATLLSAFNEPITYEGKVHNIESSIGLTLSTPDATPHTLLVEADLSLLEAKRSGRGRAVVYKQRGSQIGELVRALPDALAGGEFSMHLQPVVNVATGDIVHYEALARWTRPSGEQVSPAVFVPLIEAFGLAGDLTRAMLVNVGDLLVRTPQALPRIWINVSPVEFNGPDLSGRLLAIIDELNLDADQIGIEMTERSAIGDLVGVEDELLILRNRGVKIAIDDFGAGYSPLGHLRDLPVDVLKIDRSLIADIDSDEGAQQIVRGIIGFARSLGLALVAEGVERDEELAFLRAEGIDMVQGWLTGRPGPGETIIEQAATADKATQTTDK